MLLHTFKLIYRNFLRFPGTFLINVLGLSSGLACSLLIFLWISDELHFDKFHVHDERLFQVIENQHNSSGLVSREATPIGMAYVLNESMPEIDYAATVTPMAWLPKFIIENKGEQIKNEGKFVGKDFFRIFSFDLIYGTKERVFEDVNAVVISEALAIKLFGSIENATDKTVLWHLGEIKKESVISGIFKTVPSNSSEPFDILLNIELLGEIMNFAKDDLSSPGPSTFILLKPGVDIKLFNKKITRLMFERTGNKQSEFFLSKYSDRYLYGKYENGIQTGGRIEYVKLFAVIGLIILLIACINFVNLSTARASRRMKEVGIKKAMGAGRLSLVKQYLGESLLISLFSLGVALLVVAFFLPFFNDLTGKQLILNLTKENVLGFFCITLFTGILAGSYLALYLSELKTVAILKGKIITSISEQFVRKGLVMFQLAVSFIFIASVIVVHKQISFIQHKNLGYDKNNILYLEIEGNVATTKNTFLQKVRTLPGVQSASAMVGNVVGSFGNPFEVTFEDRKVLFNRLAVDYMMIETLGIPMKFGRTFRDVYNDTDKVIINSVAADRIGLTHPLGKVIDLGGRKLEIIGVTENFHYRSLHEEITPLAFMLETEQLWNILIKLDGNRQEEAIHNLKNLYQVFNPGYIFDYKFLDHTYQSQYAGEKRVADLSLWFGTLTIIVASLGLIGLAAFNVEKRVKEIGIRKVLGATPTDIVYLLSFGFAKLVFMAIVVALPISFYVVDKWLQRFAYSIDLEIWFFITSGLIAILIALTIVGGQAIKASLVNPTECLKDE